MEGLGQAQRRRCDLSLAVKRGREEEQDRGAAAGLDPKGGRESHLQEAEGHGARVLAEGTEEVGGLAGGGARVQHVEEEGQLADETQLRGAEV